MTLDEATRATLDKVFAGINTDQVKADETPDEGPWNRVPNRVMGRNALRGYECKKPLRSRIRRKKGRRFPKPVRKTEVETGDEATLLD